MAITKAAQRQGHINTATTEQIHGKFRPEHMQDSVNVLNFVEVKEASRRSKGHLYFSFSFAANRLNRRVRG